MYYFNTGVHAIKKIFNSGKNIVLDDNSLWEVASLDKLKSMLWLPTDNVLVKPFLGTQYKIERKGLSGKIEVIDATYKGK